MAQTPHSKIITNAAREILQPMGVQQKGQSRLWYDDHGWWLILVEFQPSGWDKGTYLNVGVHWLWYPKDYMSFDYGNRIEPFTPFISEIQFDAEAHRYAQRAAKAILDHRKKFSSIKKTAKILINEKYLTCWGLYNAAVIAGLNGSMKKAESLLTSLRLEEAHLDWQLELKKTAIELLTLVSDVNRFRNRISTIVATTRQLHHLREWNLPFF